MIEPSRFEPKRSLIAVDVRHAKLVGYRRLGRHAPAVVLPVFCSLDDKSSDPLLLYQRADQDGRISAFVGDPDLKLSDLILSSQRIDAIVVEALKPILYAYEVASEQIVVGHYKEFSIAI
jgi:hypothetical protein